MTRALRRIICRALIGVMLFAQLAVAAYACTGLALSGAAASSTSHVAVAVDRSAPGEAMAGTAGLSAVSALFDISALAAGDRPAGCDRMPGALDAALPNLCAEHCRYGQQSDQTATFTVPAAVLTSLYTLPAAPEAAARSAGPCAMAHGERAAAATPLAILHCRFRD